MPETNKLNAEFHWPLRVYIEDTDAGGIVFYVNYLKYMERARTEFMRAHGFDKAAVFSTHLMFVVRAIAVDYRRPAKLDDELIATARIVERRATQLTFEQRILRGAEELCGGRVNIACVDQHTLKPKRIPEDLLIALAAARSQ
ncbi:MAG TPA: tol-pal system-associated acyl-CoA thioesterase [Spongiibacteraceae bacterium]|jgi:tol-pal system-associated acyl-CoA thioesterase